MTKRARIAIGMAAGLVWGLGLLGLGWSIDTGIPPEQALAMAGFPAGCVMVALIGMLAAVRFRDDRLVDGAAFAPGSRAERLQAVLRNTVEQSLLAALIWPLAALSIKPNGGDVVLVLGLGFGVTRVLFWIGYAASPPLRAFGFAGGFYPTVLLAVLTVIIFAHS
ncbi:MAG: MAPEG family protein [Paracoccaceae bacterium]